MSNAEAEIWQKEFAIFRGRGAGDLSHYINVAAEAYMGWPPIADQPLGFDKLKANAANEGLLKGEVIEIIKKGFTRQGSTAIAYFTTHRTRLGEGSAKGRVRDVDEYFENIHVWSYTDGEWRLVGGMARSMSSD